MANKQKEMKWDYLSIHHYLNHWRFFKGRPLTIYRTARGFFKTLVLKKRVLRSVELAVTYNCQLRCDKCFALKWLEEEKKPFLTVEQIRNLWEQAYNLGAVHINLTGGEPLLRKDICDVVRACKPKGTVVSIVTNAIALTEEKARELKEAGLNTFQISLDRHSMHLVFRASRDTHQYFYVSILI